MRRALKIGLRRTCGGWRVSFLSTRPAIGTLGVSLPSGAWQCAPTRVSTGVQRADGPLRSFSSPFTKGGFRGIGSGVVEVGTAYLAIEFFKANRGRH